MLDQAAKYLVGNPCLVRVILFDKSRHNNWSVSWHQDKTIALSNKVELEGWRGWSKKEGIYHVQPPLAVLNNMVTFRLHIDPATKDNGCLRVIPGSHQHGLLQSEQINQYVLENDYLECEMNSGSVLVMRPHLIHSSAKGSYHQSSLNSRRVIHVEYSSYQLPRGISWA
ncbi:phytanoyl-CoA dioxygenase family protein [Aliikangiella coralliicola]|uniref:Phytanoyl-CoA dioxygenase family protein n=1 Tax=Aliikangiella coralliicola TaxID=2592383 RepID=A0A545UGT4_9GAMM|nr:phytanoyl-CoA dioxygenase family protein [Aliikangiella coralliicola]